MMGTYTMHDDPRVDEKIRKDLDIIVTEILPNMNPVTILLAGSFGRGEGSVLVRGSQVIKVKDYDIVIIADRRSILTLDKLQDLRDRIEARCGFSELETQYKLGKSHLEFLQFTPEQFLEKTHQGICDINRSSMVLYGRDIRQDFKLDLQKMALSSVYFRMLKNMKILLNNFSLDFSASPPQGMERFSLIFFCTKVYMSMEIQLTLCHGISHPSSGIRGRNLKDAYNRLYPELAKMAPDLPERIRYASELKLFPDLIETSAVDPVGMWFETQRDLDYVMKYCLNTFTHADSDDWEILSDRFYRSLCNEYHFYQVEHFLDKRYGIKRSGIISFLGNIMYRMSDTNRYFIHFLRKKKIRPEMYALSPVFKILAIAPLLLFSLCQDGHVDKKLFADFYNEISFLFPNLGKEIQEPTADNWEALKTMLLGEIGTVNRILNP